MSRLLSFLFAFVLLAPASASHAGERDVFAEALPRILPQIQQSQAFYLESYRVFERTTNAEFAIDAGENGEIPAVQAVSEARAELAAASGELASLQERAKDATPPVSGAKSYDAVLAQSWSVIYAMPEALEARIDLVERMIEALEKGDRAAQDSLDAESSLGRSQLLGAETALMRVSLALITEGSPQNALTRAWIASNEAMTLIEGASYQNFSGEGADYGQIGEGIGSQAAEMRQAVEAGHERSKTKRQRSQIASALGGLFGQSKEDENLERILLAYQRAFAVEAEMVAVIDDYAALFSDAGMAESLGDIDFLARAESIDARYAKLVEQRGQETVARTELIQSLSQ